MELPSRLYVSDVDGTLFENGEPKISEQGAELFRKLVKRGIALTIASGRNLYGVYDLAQECGITLPVIAYNGSAIYDLKKGKMLCYFAMEQTAAAKLCGLFDGANLPFKAKTFDKVICYGVFLYFDDKEYAQRAAEELLRVAKKSVLIGELPIRSHRTEHLLFAPEEFEGWDISDGFYDPYRKDRFNAALAF